MKFKSFLAVILAELIAFAPILPISIPAAHAQATILPNGKSCFQATTGISGMIGTIGAITPGSGYVNGSYGGVPLTGGSGTNGTANITVSGGVVSTVTILNSGVQFVVGDVLSAASATIGGSGSGFSFPVASTSINSSLAGGTVAYYIPNTLTIKQTWQDAGETILNQNPVPLDANGCAIVYGSGTYRQILEDSLNDTVWDVVTSSTGSSSSSGGTVFVAGVPVGTLLPWSATYLPTNYLYTAGQAVSRTTYAQLLTAVTFQQNISCQSGIATITVPTTVSDGTPIGAPIEASCFAPGTTVSSKTSGQLTLSTTATATVSTSSTIFPWGDGDAATTFNVPDYRGRVPAGRDNMNASIAGRLTSTYYGVNPDALGASGGSQSEQLTLQSQLPSASFTVTGTITTTINGGSGNQGLQSGTGGPVNIGGAGSGGTNVALTAASSLSAATAASGGSSTPFSIVQPSTTADYIIKALPDTTSGGLTGATDGVLYNAGGLPGTTNAGINGQLLLGVTGSAPIMATMSQDCAITNAGVITCTKTNNVAFAPSATTDTTNASNISSGTLPSARLPLATNSTIGAMEGDGSTISCIAGVCTSIGSSATAITVGTTNVVGGTTGNCLTVGTTLGNRACGFLTGTVLAETGAATPLTGACGDTITLGGSSQYTLTLNAASGYAANCGFLIVNLISETSSKTLAINGITVRNIYPGESIIVSNQSNTWTVAPQLGRYKALSAMPFFIRPDGSDTVCDGLTNAAAAGASGQACAFKTANACEINISNNIDINAQSVGCRHTCASAPCIFPNPTTDTTQLLNLTGGTSFVGGAPYYKGDCTTPTNAKFAPTVAVNADIQITLEMSSVPIQICGFEFAGGSNVSYGMYISGDSSVNLVGGPWQCDVISSTPAFGYPAGICIGANSHGHVYLNSNYTTTGSVGAVFSVTNGAYMEVGSAITATGAPSLTWAQGYAYVQFNGAAALGSITFTGYSSTSGPGCNVGRGGSMNISGAAATYFPNGGTTCSVAGGGVTDTAGNRGQIF